jgi:hypothetical protein
MALNVNGNGSNGATDEEMRSPDAATRKFAAQLGLDDDDPMLPLLQANAQLEAKVEQWSTAILELAVLARQQNQAMQATSQNSLKLASALSSFEQESAQLRQLIKLLGGSLTALKGANGKGSEGLNQNALQTLVPMLQSIHLRLAAIEQQHENAETDRGTGNVNQQQVKRWGWSLWIGQAVVCLSLIWGFALHNARLQTAQAALTTQSSWQLTKLARIEKALGVQPDK